MLEIESWTFLESWEDFLPWRSEFHRQVVLYSDASPFAWGAVLSPDVQSVAIRDYWPSSQSTIHINCKEILALCNALESLSSTVNNCWVDVFTDSQVLLKAWHRRGTKSQSLIASLKHLFGVIFASNIHLNLFHIPSKLNVADPPSRTLSLQDSKLSPRVWAQLQSAFGGPLGHSVDLMALPSNVQSSMSGSALPFFSPYPVPGSSGTNVFAQRPPLHRDLFANPYAFPPFLIPDLLRFLSNSGIQCTLVIPDVRPCRFWWAILKQHESFILAEKGSKGIVLPPTTSGYSPTWALPWDLWAFRFHPM